MNRFSLPALLFLASACIATPLLADEAVDWYPSRFGADDRIGAANHLSPEIVKQAAGLVTTGNYGHNVEQGLAFAYLAPEHAEPGTHLQVRVVGDLKPARVLGEPIYDPTSARLRM